MINDSYRSRPEKISTTPDAPEKLITVKAAAEALGLPTWKLSRAAAQGVFPTYRLLNSRRLVKLSEVLAAIEASRQGGGRS
jgi:hypothetical protein